MVYIIVNTFPGFRSIRIDEVIYYFTFIYNMVLLDCLKERGYWWDMYLNNKYIKNYNGRLMAEVPRICRQYILEYILLKDIPGNINTLF